MKAAFFYLVLISSTAAFGATEEFSFDMSGHEQRRLQANVLHGGIVVRGYDGDQVSVTAEFEEPGLSEMPAGESGMRALPNVGQEVRIHQDGGDVIVRAGTEGRPVQLAVQVPRDTSLTLTVRQNGGIRVEGVAGEMDLQNSSGPIRLEGLRNSVVAHAHADDLSASFAVPELPGPSAFSSWSGNVELTFPADIRADLRWRSNYGAVLSDLEVTGLRTVSARRETGESAVVEGYTIGSVNGGGPEISATSYTGDILFRQRSQ